MRSLLAILVLCPSLAFAQAVGGGVSSGGGGGGSGDVVGPASSADLDVPVFSGLTGKLLADPTGVQISGSALTTTKQLVLSGITTDITTGANEAFTVVTNGTGNISLRAPSNSVALSGTTVAVTAASGGGGWAFTGSGSGGIATGLSASTAAWALISGLSSSGSSTTVNATTKLWCAAESLTSSSSGTAVWCVYGDGKQAVETRQAATCASDGTGGPGALPLDPTSSVVYLTNNDADGCVVTISDASGVLGSDVRIIVVSSAGGVVTFPDVGNVLAAPACADTTGLGANDVFSMHYADAADDLYVGIGCGDN